MNFYVGTRADLTISPDRLESLGAKLRALKVGFAVLSADGDRHTVSLLDGLDVFNPPTDPYVQGCLLNDDDSPLQRFERHSQRPEIRDLLAEHGLSSLLGKPGYFMCWGDFPWQHPLPRLTPPNEVAATRAWSVIVGFSTSKKSVLEQKKVQAGLAEAGFVTGNYGNYRRVFGASVGTQSAGDTAVLDLELEARLPKIRGAMVAFLAGPGKKLAPLERAPDAVEAFLCNDE